MVRRTSPLQFVSVVTVPPAPSSLNAASPSTLLCNYLLSNSSDGLYALSLFAALASHPPHPTPPLLAGPPVLSTRFASFFCLPSSFYISNPFKALKLLAHSCPPPMTTVASIISTPIFDAEGGSKCHLPSAAQTLLLPLVEVRHFRDSVQDLMGV
jgi:hypothetical protein